MTNMETKFNFNSQVCSSRSQSERLLELGLKKETADMWYPRFAPSFPIPLTEDDYVHELNNDGDVPAWSLHRLLSMLPSYVQIETHEYGRKYIAALDLELDSHLNVIYKEGVEEPCYDKYFYTNDAYESVCRAIEWLIKEGYFNKEYLED